MKANPEVNLYGIFIILTKEPGIRCVLRAYNAAKCDCGRGSATDPRWESLQRSPRPSNWFQGGRFAAERVRGRGKGKGEGEGRGS